MLLLLLCSPFCGKRFESGAKYSNHKVRCEPEKRQKWLARTFPCKFCNAIFKSATAQINHERSKHTLEKPHQCSVCDASFSLRSGLRRHLLIHNMNVSAFCSVCNKPFVNRTEQMRHEKTCTKYN
jgi:uncharacterized Zn-finger protein